MNIKRFSIIFFGLLLFDLIYVFIYDQFMIGLKPEFLNYPLALIKVLALFPAVLFNKSLPFYALIPTYQAILIFIGNFLVQAFLIYRFLFGGIRNKKDYQ